MDNLDTLSQLYFGKIRPLETIGSKNSDLIEIRKTLLKMTNDFKASLDEYLHKDMLEELERIEEVQSYSYMIFKQ